MSSEIMKCVHLLQGEHKLMKGKALRKHSLHEKTAASVLLKLFISGNECMSRTPFSNVNNIHVHSMIKSTLISNPLVIIIVEQL